MTAAGRALAVAALLALTSSCAAAPDHDLLRRSWEGYRARFITPEGRVVRPEHHGDTVSEGQAYALLRAAWMDDHATFDRVWAWTRAHMARTGRTAPNLLGWHWTADDGGRMVDWNVATDADTDAALALLLAADRWSGPSMAGLPPYGEAAGAMLDDLVRHAVAEDARGTLLMLPGVWADARTGTGGLVLNPSYFAPASYRVFHAATGHADWLRLAAGAYEVLDTICVGPPDQEVVPDWVRWRSAGEWEPEPDRGRQSGWESVRVPWRVATDALWFDDPRAQAVLTRCLEPFVMRRLRAGHGLAVEHSLSGEALSPGDHPLANALYSFALADPIARDALLARVTHRLVPTGAGVYFGEPDRYYVNSLAYLPFLARAGWYVPPGS